MGGLLNITTFFKGAGSFKGDDLNDAGMGIFLIGINDIANRPDATSPAYSVLLSFETETLYAVQFFASVVYFKVLYIRVRNTPRYGWTAWRKIELTSI